MNNSYTIKHDALTIHQRELIDQQKELFGIPSDRTYIQLAIDTGDLLMSAVLIAKTSKDIEEFMKRHNDLMRNHINKLAAMGLNIAPLPTHVEIEDKVEAYKTMKDMLASFENIFTSEYIGISETPILENCNTQTDKQETS